MPRMCAAPSSDAWRLMSKPESHQQMRAYSKNCVQWLVDPHVDVDATHSLMTRSSTLTGQQAPAALVAHRPCSTADTHRHGCFFCGTSAAEDLCCANPYAQCHIMWMCKRCSTGVA